MGRGWKIWQWKFPEPDDLEFEASIHIEADDGYRGPLMSGAVWGMQVNDDGHVEGWAYDQHTVTEEPVAVYSWWKLVSGPGGGVWCADTDPMPKPHEWRRVDSVSKLKTERPWLRPEWTNE